MNNRINIFLASSIKDSNIDQMEIENFIGEVSDKFEEHYSISIRPLVCEEDTREEWADLIKKSSLCFFIFFKRIGEDTNSQFDEALKLRELCEKDGENVKPKIYTYFKEFSEDEVDGGIKDFMKMLDSKLGHYYSVFEKIDTVKLRMLLAIQLEEMDCVEIKAENGFCVADGEKILSLENVSEFANNSILNNYKRELSEVTDKYLDMKAEYDKENCTDDFYREYCSVASKKKKLEDDIDELQKNIFRLSKNMVEDDMKGIITSRQRKAYALLEEGEYEKAVKVLDEDDIDESFERDMANLENEKNERVKSFIGEHRTAIDILKTMYNYKNRFSDIYRRYEKICDAAEKYKVEIDVLYDYAMLLSEQRKEKKAVELIKKFSELLKICPDSSSHNEGDVYNSLGYLYHELDELKLSEENKLKALKKYKKLTIENPEKYEGNLALSLNNLGALYKDLNDYTKAVEYEKEALKKYEKLTAENPEKYEGDLATSLNNLGMLYQDLKDYSKAAEYMEEAVKIREKLTLENPEKYEGDLALSLNNLGMLYRDLKNYTKAVEYEKEALKKYEKLTLENPEKYEEYLAASLNNLGALYRNLNDYTKAAEYMEEAVEIIEKLYKKAPQKYEPLLALFLFNLGFLYLQNRHITDARKYFSRAKMHAVKYKSNDECKTILNVLRQLGM